MKKSFHFLWSSQLFSNLGDVFYIVGLIAILYAQSASAFTLALLPFINTIGRMLSSTIAPLIFNRIKLKYVLLVSQTLKTILIFVIAFQFYPTQFLTVLLGLIFWIAFMDGFAQPASTALLPRIVDKSNLLRANSILSVINESTQLGGWALGGVIVAITSGQFIIILTFILFGLSTILISLINDPTPIEKQENSSKLNELLEGFRVIWNNPGIRTIHVMLLLESIANVVWIAAIMYIFVADVLNVSEAWWGYINTAFFLGLIISGIICAKLEAQLQKQMHKIIVFSSFAVAVITLLFGLNHIAILALALSFFFGFFDQFKGILLHTWIQITADEQQLAKIYSAQGVMLYLVFALSTLVAGALAQQFSVTWLFVGAFVSLLVSAIYFTSVKKRFTNI